MYTKCVTLYTAAIQGDWEAAESFPVDTLTGKITEKEETALHVAAISEKAVFVEKLVLKVGDKRALLEAENVNGNTALCYAAMTGVVRIAQFMLDSYSNQPGHNLLANRGTSKPLSMAALFGHREMVRYLLTKTSLQDWTDVKDRADLFTNCIRFGFCDEALKMLKDFEDLATEPNRSDATALYVLAREPSVFAPETQPVWRRFINVLCTRMNNNITIPRSKAVELVRALYDIIMNRPDLEKGNKDREIARPLFSAAEVGNDDFIIELIRCDPDLLWRYTKDLGTIFHIAVRNRHESIFSLLYDNLGSIKDLVADREVSGGRNMLHLAGELAPPTQLNVVSGAALQMQREFLWFKEVEKIVEPSYKDVLNSENKTPQMVFNEEHRDLMTAGERWMKETAKSSMVVAALIATVMFTTVFTVPGGYNGSNGEPILEKQKWFFVFALADALALLCSCTSILMFHSIITSRYTETDFLESLPFRLMVGVAALFASVAAMMVAFCVTFVLYYENVPWIFIPMFALFACVPTLYVFLKYPLLADLIWSTFHSRFMFLPRKRLFL